MERIALFDGSDVSCLSLKSFRRSVQCVFKVTNEGKGGTWSELRTQHHIFETILATILNIFTRHLNARCCQYFSFVLTRHIGL